MRRVVCWCHSVFRRWEMPKPNVSTRLSYPSASSGPRQTSLRRSSSGTSTIRRSTWIRSLTSRCSGWVLTWRRGEREREALCLCFRQDQQTEKAGGAVDYISLREVIPPEMSATKPRCSLRTERKELWQHTQGTSRVWEDETGECVIPWSVLNLYFRGQAQIGSNCAVLHRVWRSCHRCQCRHIR